MHGADRSCDSRTSGALWVAGCVSVPAELYCRLHAGCVVLEVGCGGGLGCLALAEAYPAATVIGHDGDGEAIARARALAQAAALDARVTFVVSNSEELPRDSFDLVTLAQVSGLRHAPQVLNAVRNAIVPGGVCVLLEPPVSFVLGGARQRQAADRLRALAEQAGFSQIALVSHGSADVYELRR